MNTDMEDLIERVQSLPPELYSEIRDLTFTVNLDSILTPEHLDPRFTPELKPVFHINKSWKPPAILQVSRTLREQHSPAFYHAAVFTFADDLADPDNLELLMRWLKSLSPKQLKMVTRSQIRILTSSTMLKHPPPYYFRHCMRSVDVDIVVDLHVRVLKAINASNIQIDKPWNIRFHFPLQEDPGKVWDAHINRKMNFHVDSRV